MGFFDFLKKKKEPRIVYFKNLDKWQDSYVEEIGIKRKVRNFKEEAKTKIGEVREAMRKLEEASLLNEDIPERVKHIMVGNRKNYIQKISQFLEEIRFPEEYSEIRNFSISLSERIDELSKETQKSFFVLKEFLEEEAVKVAKKVKDIENMAIKLRQDIEKARLDKMDEIRQLMDDFKNSEKALEELNKEREKKQAEINEVRKKGTKIKKKIDELKNSSYFREYNELKERIEENKEQTKGSSQEIIAHFSTLEKALKKYKRGSLNEALINKYLEGPVKALIADSELKLLEILEKLRKILPKLKLKDKKEEKTKQTIALLNKEFLTKKRSELQASEDSGRELKKKMLNNTAVMSISEQESWFENTQENLRKREKELEEIEHKIERTNPKLIKQKMRDVLKEFDVKLKL